MNYSNKKVFLLGISFIVTITCAFGYFNDFHREDWELTVQIYSLLVTVWFTWQLVNNDNMREERANLEIKRKEKQELFQIIKNTLEYNANMSLGQLQSSGSRLCKRYGNPIVLEAYDRLLLENEAHSSVIPSKEKFQELLKDYGVIF